MIYVVLVILLIWVKVALIWLYQRDRDAKKTVLDVVILAPIWVIAAIFPQRKL